MAKMQDYEKLEVASAAALRHWFEENYAQAESIWLGPTKKVPQQNTSQPKSAR